MIGVQPLGVYDSNRPMTNDHGAVIEPSCEKPYNSFCSIELRVKIFVVLI